MRRTRGIAGWTLLVGVVVLVARTLAYALAPDPRAEALGQLTGGPRPVVVASVVLGLGALLATVVLWAAALGVRERHRLRRDSGAPPRLQLVRALLRAVALTGVSAAVFTAIESTIHVEEGLGFHGLHCLLGPVHRDALPLIGALALVASALVEAVRLALAFGRRVVAAESGRRRLPRALRGGLVASFAGTSHGFTAPANADSRGPPALSYC
jgi:hypothetical protein